jgi:hypothetical protein
MWKGQKLMLSCCIKRVPGNTIATTTDASAFLGFTVLPHPAYSLNLAPSNFHLFPKLKETTGVKISVLKKLLQYACGFGREEETFLKTELKTC